MHREKYNKLQAAVTMLSERVRFGEIAAPMLQNNVLIRQEYYNILGVPESDQIEAMVSVMAGKEDGLFDTFIEVLRSNNHSAAAESILTMGDVTDSVPYQSELVNNQNRLNQRLETAREQRPGKSGQEAPLSIQQSISELSTLTKQVAHRDNTINSSHCNNVGNSAHTAIPPHRENSVISALCDNPESTAHIASCTHRDNSAAVSAALPVESAAVPTPVICQIRQAEDLAKAAKLSQSPPSPEERACIGEGEGTQKLTRLNSSHEYKNPAVNNDMIRLVKVNYRASRDWTSLAHALGVSNLVPKIRTKVLLFGEDLGLCIVYLLEEWMGMQPKEATLKNLVGVLHREGFNDVAEELVDKFAS